MHLLMLLLLMSINLNLISFEKKVRVILFICLIFSKILHPTTLILVPVAPDIFGGESMQSIKEDGLSILCSHSFK
jgi:hypothetical protein